MHLPTSTLLTESPALQQDSSGGAAVLLSSGQSQLAPNPGTAAPEACVTADEKCSDEKAESLDTMAPSWSVLIGPWRLSYIKTVAPSGWGHNEGHFDSGSIIELSVILVAGRKVGYRLAGGKHSLWLMR